MRTKLTVRCGPFLLAAAAVSVQVLGCGTDTMVPLRSRGPGNIHDTPGIVSGPAGETCATFPATPKPHDPSAGMALSAETIDRFIDWAASSTEPQLAEVRARIADAAPDPAVVNGLTARLLQTPANAVTDFPRTLVLLSVIGQTRSPAAVDPLIRFIGSPMTCPGDRDPAGAGSPPSPLTETDFTSSLWERAVEMLAFIGTSQAFSTVLQAAHAHPCRNVRVAAIDAYLFNHGDSNAAKLDLIAVVQPRDMKMVGVPRRTRHVKVQEFDARVTKFYADNPGEVPPRPTRSSSPHEPLDFTCAVPTSSPPTSTNPPTGAPSP